MKLKGIEFIETYKGLNIYKLNGFYQIGLNGASVSNLQLLKDLLIDRKKTN